MHLKALRNMNPSCCTSTVSYTHLLSAGALLFGWGYRRGAASVVVEETTRIDTVFYPRPEPLPGTYRFADISVPVLLFAPPDTVTETVVVKVGADSVQMKVAMETRPYSCLLYTSGHILYTKHIAQ